MLTIGIGGVLVRVLGRGCGCRAGAVVPRASGRRRGWIGWYEPIWCREDSLWWADRALGWSMFFCPRAAMLAEPSWLLFKPETSLGRMRPSLRVRCGTGEGPVVDVGCRRGTTWVPGWVRG